MPLELIVIAFVVIAFVAIAARFMPRDATGARRLPRIVDESIGMYVVRRALGRPTEAASDRAAAHAEAAAKVDEDAIAYRIGVPGAPAPTVPTRFVVSGARPQAHKIPPVVPVTARPTGVTRPQARRRGLAPLLRPLAGILTVMVVVLAAFAAVSLPARPDEAVLSATGTPPAGAPTAPVVSPSGPAAPPSGAPSAEPSSAPQSSPVGTAQPSAPIATATPTSPTATARPTPRPTPAPTRKPTPTPPTPTATPAPTPTPSEEPTPTPTASAEPTPTPTASEEPTAAPSQEPPGP
ncbi:MAG TPA: hypothetical protein VFV72_08060 [Candidatus Limnocylindrales bacterium]|nr:hypothetical protein [Candidatus Limnocylindrales bacterium]